MDIQTVLIISAIIEVITLICFFVLCYNVACLKNRFSYFGAKPQYVVAMLIAFGSKDKAKEEVINYILSDANVMRAYDIDKESFKSSLGQYMPLMKKVGINDIDIEGAFECKNLL